jgi:S-adenosylmethionine:tRNA ribosyltransferase-isomerase
MKVTDFSYSLPEELIALHPPAIRGTTRLLALNRKTGSIEHRKYYDLVDYLQTGDVLVLNDTKVIKARLLATNKKGQKRELLLLEDHHTIDVYKRKVLYRGKLRPNEILTIDDSEITIDEIYDGGIAMVSCKTPLLYLAETSGTVPLPPYMNRDATKADIDRYQTVFAKEPGSVAAPTASLNFTQELKQKLEAKGVIIVYLTLHVGLGTFLPIRTDDISNHTMHSEYFEIPKETIEIIQYSKHNGGNIVALGTTVARTLEFVHHQILEQKPVHISGEANIFIYPGYDFKVIDGLLTNFHAPKSTVLMLAAAFAGWDNLEHAYKEAVAAKYSFLSYGDSMFIC